MRGKPQRDGIIFMGKFDPSRHHKGLDWVIIGVLGWMKWLKKWAGKYLYFIQFFLHYILSGENLIG